ncbi:MAG: hypothetical protein INR71_08045, partial [Terriglobus roseus]|nr:hypothetical protein [Terriglobus roseus]
MKFSSIVVGIAAALSATQVAALPTALDELTSFFAPRSSCLKCSKVDETKCSAGMLVQ